MFVDKFVLIYSNFGRYKRNGGSRVFSQNECPNNINIPTEQYLFSITSTLHVCILANASYHCKLLCHILEVL